MQLPTELTAMLDAELRALRANPEYDLKPGRRVAIYGAFGPTFLPTNFSDRVRLLAAGRPTLTMGDEAGRSLGSDSESSGVGGSNRQRLPHGRA